MKQLTGNQVRQMFLDYFASKDHMIEPGVSLIPHNDPTLLWINAGVAGLKKYFDGTEKPKKNRIANAQKSIRTNDIENVGKTARHHTFFEMLGNFSIGDYFKEEAIPFAWEFLTSPEWIGIDKDKLYITVYTDDEDAYRIWTGKCGVDPSHILRTKENFWEIGKGPGGPDTEIHFDRGEKYDPQHLGEKLFFDEMENDRYVEVWNVVFSQYDCDPSIDRKDYKELPQKNIDTGMGLERLVALIQGGETNFDTDLFLPIIHETEKLAHKPYEGENKMAFRVIADHIRTLVFALSDGAGFSNSGRGYVLRRVLRRAVRFGMKLGLDEPFLYKLVDVVDDIMKDYYPYLADHAADNKELIKSEEKAFFKTLKYGQALLDDEMAKAKDGKLDGDVVFRLYDTYGFPFEMTQEIAEENGLKVDRAEFDAHMKEQKERARAARNTEDSFSSQHKDIMSFTTPSEFIGYDNLEAEGTILALFKDGNRVDTLEDDGQVIVDPCVFYAQSGGQVADTGTISAPGLNAHVVDAVKTRNGQHLLSVRIEDGSMHEGQKVHEKVNADRRKKTTANHSATHLLQSALKSVLGDQIHQAGSYVGPDYLRFDFNQRNKIGEDKLGEIEEKVNAMIMAGHPVTKEIMPIEEAKKTGAMALFDEKYGDMVRVVTMGDVSKEFCAGCHVNNTGEIGVLHIVSEESIGSDTRRITAKTGLAAYEDFHHQQKQLESIARSAKAKSLKDLETKVDAAYEHAARLHKEADQLRSQILVLKANEWAKDAKQAGDIRVLTRQADTLDGGALKEIAATLKGQNEDMVIILASGANNRVVFAAGVGAKAMEKGVNAGKLVKAAGEICGGKGGGKADLAQSGGKDASKIDEALAAAANMAAEAAK